MNRILELVTKIKEAQDAYYNTGDAIMEDSEFDKLWDELTYLDPNNPILHKVGEDSGSVFQKCEHLMHMFSQQKSKEPEEFKKWAEDHQCDEWVVQHKLDGSSIELQYICGKFYKAVTRGNGIIGDDVTSNISRSKGVVKQLIDNFTGSVRGEVLLFHDDFIKYYKDKANCRNAANGIMKRKDGEGSEHLTVVCYDAYSTNETAYKQFETEYDKFDFLHRNKFNVVPTFYMDDIDDIIRLRDELGKSRFEDLDYDIDGIVIKCPKVDPEDVKRDRPDKQIAFKFSLDEQTTIVRGIEWSVSGRTRTPVAICDPVFLNGTTVKRANLCNIGLITKMGLKIGSSVVMVKRGEIIPKIERVVSTPANLPSIEFPTVCETCGTPLIKTDAKLYCPNLKCPNTLKHRLLKWCYINKIYGLGSESINKLFDEGFVTSVKNFYDEGIEGRLASTLGAVIAKKVMVRIENSRHITLSRVLAGLDLDDIGEETADLITTNISSNWKTLKSNLSIQRLMDIPGIAETSATSIYKQLTSMTSEIDSLCDVLEIESEEKNVNSKIAGKIFCFTGALNTMDRNTAKDLVKRNGATMSGNVTAKTDYLVTNDTTSGSLKNEAAKKLGVKIITEKQFLSLIGK